MLNYLASNQEYIELVLNEWSNTAKSSQNYQPASVPYNSRKSSFDDSELEQNVVSLILNLIRYLFHNSDIMQDRIERNNGIPLLSFLLQRLPRRFIDINLLRICQEFVNETINLNDKSLLNSIYEHLIFDFRVWNKADYEIRIGHIQYISTKIKDDKKYFRKKYGIQFFLDVIKTYFGSSYKKPIEPNETQRAQNMNDEDLRNLRNSFFGLIKYYAQKEIKINELNSMISFLSQTKNQVFQNDLLDMLISLLEAPNLSSDQLYLLLFEPNMADGLYSLLITQNSSENPNTTDVSQIQKKILKVIRILLKTKKVYDKNKSRLRLDDCGGYAGLISKLTSEFYTSPSMSNFASKNYKNNYHQDLVLDLLENFLIEEQSLINYDNLWHILSLLTLSWSSLNNPTNSTSPNSGKLSNTSLDELLSIIKLRIKVCEMIIGILFSTTTTSTSSTNPIKLLTKAPAWQDIICQLLCIERKLVKSESEQKLQPPIIIETKVGDSSDKGLLSQIGQTEMQEEDVNDGQRTVDDDDWENLDLKEMNSNEMNNSNTVENANKENNDSLSLFTSTPSNKIIKFDMDPSDDNKFDTNKHKAIKNSKSLLLLTAQNNLSRLGKSKPNEDEENKELDQGDNAKGSLSYLASSLGVMDMSSDPTHDGEKNTSKENKLESSSDAGNGMGCRVDFSDVTELSNNQFNKQVKISSQVDESNLQTILGDTIFNLVNTNEANELCEKVLYLIFRLLWDGIPGSNEEAWKVNYPCFLANFINDLIFLRKNKGTMPNIFKST